MDEDKEIINGVNETLKNLMIDLIKKGEVEVCFDKMTYHTYLTVRIKIANEVLGEGK